MRALSLLIAAYLISLVFSYEKTWMHPELPMVFHPSAIKNGTAPTLSDFSRILKFEEFDSTPRSRLLSLLVLIWNEKLRLWIFRFVPPHPSFSVTWLFTLVLSPLLFFLVARRLTDSARASALGTAIFVSSVGNLSGVSLLFHPGKPLAIFFLLLSLFLFLRVDEELPRGDKRTLPFFFAALFLGYLCEETFWFILVAIPLLQPSPLFTEKRFALFRIGFFGSFFTFVVALQVGLSYPFLQYALTENFGLRLPLLLPFGSNAFHLIRDFFLPSTAGGWAIAVCAALIVLLVKIAARANKEDGLLLLRLFFLAGLFTAYQTLLFTRGNILIRSGFYYGSAFSLFVALFLAVLFSSRRVPKLTSVLAASLVCAISITNFEAINREWRAYHTPIYRGALPERFSALREGQTVTRDEILRLWKNPGDPALFPGLPPDAYGFLSELEQSPKKSR